MANTLITPEWLMRDMLAHHAVTPSMHAALTRANATLFNPARNAIPLTPVVVALGVAAFIASPQPISRRAFLGLAWKGRG